MLSHIPGSVSPDAIGGLNRRLDCIRKSFTCPVYCPGQLLSSIVDRVGARFVVCPSAFESSQKKTTAVVRRNDASSRVIKI